MMWDDRFLFILGMLTAIGIWISIATRRAVRRRSERAAAGAPDARIRHFLGEQLFSIILVIALVMLLLHGILAGRQYGFEWPGLGAILALLVGAVVGSFSARFTWSLFGARFGSRDPVVGVTIIAILLVVYSFPIYRAQFVGVWEGLGLKSLKTPGGVELTFSETTSMRTGSIGAANSGKEEMPSAISNPSNPRPGLDGLDSAVSNYANSYIVKDDRYIAYLQGDLIPILESNQAQYVPTNLMLQKTLQFLVPGRVLVGCLREYVNIFPDSQLVLVDTKPVIQWLFRLHAYGKQQLSHGGSTEFEQSQARSTEFGNTVEDVRINVLKALGVFKAETVQDFELAKSPEIERLLGEAPPMSDVGRPADQFTVECNKARLEVPRLAEGDSLEILQPYTSIALANLLVAHGSPDEAITVLTGWLDLWRCARGEGIDTHFERRMNAGRSGGCEIGVNKQAQDLPPWLGFRAEFELGVILYRLVGEGNIAYRDFMSDHAKRFRRYLEMPVPMIDGDDDASSRSISMRTEAQKCVSQGQVRVPSVNVRGDDRELAAVKEVRTALLRTLVQDENTVLRSELHFVSELRIPDLENLYERGSQLSKFSAECLDPENADNRLREAWVPTAADFQITAGLLALAVADQYQSIATSADERQRAVVIREQGKSWVEGGYRVLRPIRDADRGALAAASLTDRVFTISSWEESCLLAEHALEQLRRSEL